MWALRRASVPLRNRGFNVGTSHACSFKATLTSCVENEAGIESPHITCSRFLSLKTFYHTGHSSLKFCMCRREFSLLASRSNKEEDNFEDPVSELETPTEDDEEQQNELQLSELFEATEKQSTRRSAKSELFKAIINAPGLSIHHALEKWVEEGKELSREDISLAMIGFCRRRMYVTALQLLEWLGTNKKRIDYIEKDYVCQLDLIARVRGLHKAEQYIESIPKSFRGETIYRHLLANCVRQNNVKVAEEIFNKMKSLELVSAFSFHCMLILYKRNDKRKIADLLSSMEKENVKPSLRTYKILIDSEGLTNDIVEMEKIVEMMKGEGVEPDTKVQGLLARNYVSAGLKEKAEAVLKKMEEENLEENRSVCPFLLTQYANLGKADEVRRIWKVCEPNPRIAECLVAIEAWAKLKKIEEAEAIFEMMVNKCETFPSRRNYAALLEVYANHNMLMKGRDLVSRIEDIGCGKGPFAWDALVNLYVQAGEVEKAESVLHKVIKQSQKKPLYSTYMAMLDQYANRGDVHNSEKIFLGMREAGYTSRLRCFQALIKAYINAKLPAYGIRERMKADNIFPNKALVSQLVQVDPFRNTAVFDLLD